MVRVRPAAVAGRFYPTDPAVLRRAIGEMLGDDQLISGLYRRASVIVTSHNDSSTMTKPSVPPSPP